MYSPAPVYTLASVLAPLAHSLMLVASGHPAVQPGALLPSWDIVADIQLLLAYHFMRNALLVGTLIALVAGPIGYFMVLRGQSFAGHTLANVGFAGAAGSLLLGLSPLLGVLGFGVLAALGIGALGERARAHWGDVAIGTVLAFALGLGLLFTQLSANFSESVYSLLFGTIVGISDVDVRIVGLTTVVTLAVLCAVGRPLLFASVDPQVAAAHGVPVRALDYTFLLLLAFAVAQAVQIVGVLLIFALLVTPAAIAQALTSRPGLAIALASVLALLFTWLGLSIAYFTPYPVGFFITSIAFGAYLLVRLRLALQRTALPVGHAI